MLWGCVAFLMAAGLFSSLVNVRSEEKKEVVVVGGGSEASLEGAGAEASRAAGVFGRTGRGVGTFSDICLLTAAVGDAGWLAGWMGGGGRRGGAFSHNQHRHQRLSADGHSNQCFETSRCHKLR